jgi:hypothetical protein
MFALQAIRTVSERGRRRREPRRPRVDLTELEREQRRRDRERARWRAPVLKERRARVVAFHEAGHAVVAAYLGLMPNEVGLEVATRFDVGVVVTPQILSGSRTKRAIILAAGGLAEERATGIPARGIDSDEASIADLGLSSGAEARARQRAAELVHKLWPFIEALVPILLEHRHLAGETAIFMALAGVHGLEEASRRIKLVRLGRAFH